MPTPEITNPSIEYVYAFLACLCLACPLALILWYILIRTELDRPHVRELGDPQDKPVIHPPSPRLARAIEQDEIELGNAYRE